jgi:alanyl-tRNA synthetase
VFLARSPDLDFQCGAMLRELLSSFGLRGGGSPDLAQGDAPGERMQELLASVIATIRNLLPPQAG